MNNKRKPAKERLLEVFDPSTTVTAVCIEAEVTQKVFYEYYKTDPQFRAHILDMRRSRISSELQDIRSRGREQKASP